jgi:hypothetical protein
MWMASSRVTGTATPSLSMDSTNLNSILLLYVILKLCMIPWSHGCKQFILFSGRKTSWMDSGLEQ